MSNKAVLFDRDGVINLAFHSNNISYPPKTIDQVKIHAGIVDSIKKIKRAGFKTFIITNQPDVDRGNTTKENVDAINNYILSMIDIDKLYTCYSSDNNHPDRKPNPGMILKAKKEFDLDLSQSFVIGDRETDILAGKACNCKTILMISNNKAIDRELADYNVENINQAANIILEIN